MKMFEVYKSIQFDRLVIYLTSNLMLYHDLELEFCYQNTLFN